MLVKRVKYFGQTGEINSGNALSHVVITVNSNVCISLKVAKTIELTYSHDKHIVMDMLILGQFTHFKTEYIFIA